MDQLEDLRRRYLTALHAMQAGVGLTQEYNPKDGTPKHLRTGINSAMISHAALVDVLIAKGIMTELEYWEAQVFEAEAEQQRYQDELKQHFGADIRLV